ncbi:MAG TPA: GTP-binding protein [Rhodopila sp.]|uniref:GTP-binding protein n=1 Tax=Rhodopila sp. TaxID=2480087 RepID=UPI002D1132C7|nr:GTP-binding protein [Rhodopila sp.]HVY16044.1 GTP-binding protein [Rhodopila sp.]
MTDTPFGPGLAWIERTVALPDRPEPRTPVLVAAGVGPIAEPGTVVLTGGPSGWVADQPVSQGGCACCVPQGGLQRGLRALLPRARRGEVARVVVETAADADPLAALVTLLGDPALMAVFRLAGVAAAGGVDEHARRRIMVADTIVAGPMVPDAVRAGNPAARVIKDLGALWREARFDPDQAANALTLSDPLAWPAAGRWLDHIVRQQAVSRITGVLHIAGCPWPMAVDTAGHHLAPPLLLPAWPAGAAPRSRLVFMGDGVDMAAIRTGIRTAAWGP